MIKKNIERFFNMLPLLEEMEFVGVSKILTVPLLDEKDTPREFSDIIGDMLDKFNKMDRKNRRELLRILEKATQGRTLEMVTQQRKEKGAYVDDAADSSASITEEQHESEN